MGAASGAMNRGAKTCWKTIQVQRPGGGRLSDPGERLAALYRFQNGQGPAEHRFVRGAEAVSVDPSDVDWEAFPVLTALEAVTRDELRRLRSLLRPDLADEPTPQAWGLD
jgi:hypothetical protein